VVVIFAVTKDNKMLLVEQYRIPVASNVIECPAGLVGDKGIENIESGVRRELLEETGYACQKIKILFKGPSSAGSSSEIITFVQAMDIEKVSDNIGDGDENIIVHEVPLDNVEDWLEQKEKEGKMISPRIYIGLHFLREIKYYGFEVSKGTKDKFKIYTSSPIVKQEIEKLRYWRK